MRGSSPRMTRFRASRRSAALLTTLVTSELKSTVRPLEKADEQNRALLLRAEALAEPAFVGACHCAECQRRTGAPFGVSAYFQKEHVRTEGPSKLYVRDGQQGRKLRYHFCPDCGTTVYWDADFRLDWIGVALGAFADPSFPQPTLLLWEATRHPWTGFQHELEHFPEQPVAAPPTRS
jgi:hypothetical protein